MAKLSKKEASKLNKEMYKLNKNLEGVRSMDKLPKAMFVIDAKKEDIAVKEANILGIPVVALTPSSAMLRIFSFSTRIRMPTDSIF